KRTSHRPWCGGALARTSVRSPTWNTAPGAVRSGRSVCSVRTTSPRTPWGRPTRPSSSSAAPKGRLLDDVDVGLDALAGTSGAHDLPERLDDAAALADQTAHIGGGGGGQEPVPAARPRRPPLPRPPRLAAAAAPARRPRPRPP